MLRHATKTEETTVEAHYWALGMVQSVIQTPTYKKDILIATDLAFKQSNQMLDAKLKDMKKHGEQNLKHKPAIQREDLRHLKESDVISPATPPCISVDVDEQGRET